MGIELAASAVIGVFGLAVVSQANAAMGAEVAVSFDAWNALEYSVVKLAPKLRADRPVVLLLMAAHGVTYESIPAACRGVAWGYAAPPCIRQSPWRPNARPKGQPIKGPV